MKGEAETEPEMRTAPNGKLMRIGTGTFILGLVAALGNAIVKNLGLLPEVSRKRGFRLVVSSSFLPLKEASMI